MDEEAFAPPVATGSPTGVEPPPDLIEMVKAAAGEVGKDFAAYLLAPLPLFGATFVMAIGGLIGLYVVLGLAMIPGMAAEDELLTLLGALFGTFVGMFGFMFALLVVTAPLQASLTRAIWATLTKEEPLTIGAAVGTVGQDVGKVLGVNLIVAVAVTIGVMLCYLPALIVGLFLIFAAPAVYIHRVDPMTAVRMSVKHATDHLSWHVGFFLLHFAGSIVFSQVPIIGPLLLSAVSPLYVLHGYRAAFGDGDVPREAMA